MNPFTYEYFPGSSRIYSKELTFEYSSVVELHFYQGNRYCTQISSKRSNMRMIYMLDTVWFALRPSFLGSPKDDYNFWSAYRELAVRLFKLDGLINYFIPIHYGMIEATYTNGEWIAEEPSVTTFEDTIGDYVESIADSTYGDRSAMKKHVGTDDVHSRSEYLNRLIEAVPDEITSYEESMHKIHTDLAILNSTVRSSYRSDLRNSF